MRVVFLTSKLNLETAGGAVIDVHLKATYLAKRGHTVSVITALSTENKHPNDLPYGVVRETLASWQFFDAHPFAYRMLKKYEADADVFYVDGHLFLYGAGAYRLLGGKIPVIGFFNIKLPGWPEAPFFARLNLLQKFKHYVRFILERTIGVFFANSLDAFIFTTPSVAALYEKHGFDARKSHIILDFAEEAGSPKRRTAHDPLRFFASGRMIPEKGFDLLIRSFSAIESTSATLTISGTGPEEQKLKALASESSARERIRFPGWVKRDELYRLMDEVDVFILPRWILEYSSVLLMEAMRRGLPVIVPKGGGLEWIAGDGGRTFADGDQGGLARSVSAFIIEPKLVEKFSERALEKAQTFTIEKLGKDLENVLEDQRRAVR